MAHAVGQRTSRDHEARIRAMFDSIAPVYDRLNRILSFGQDVLWRRAAARRARLADGEVALDVGSGTGDLAFTLLELSSPSSRVIGLDLSGEMFALARGKAARRGLEARFAMVQGSVLEVPVPDAGVDRVVSAFAMRNVGELLRACVEMRRVLRPGGRAVVLELSKPLPPFDRAYYVYFRAVLPRLARLLGGDAEAYAYLPRSLAPLPDARAFAAILGEAGFGEVRYTLLSLGAVAIHEGRA